MFRASTAESGQGPTDRSPDSARGPGAFVRRHGLLTFYALAYGLSWLAWVPYILSQNGLGIVDISFPKILGTEQLAGVLPGAYLGPLGAAFLVTALSEGRPGLRRWTGRLFRLGVGWRWYALALVGVPAIIVAGTLVLPGAAAGLRFPPWSFCSSTCRSSCSRWSPRGSRRSPGGAILPWCATSGSTVPSWAP